MLEIYRTVPGARGGKGRYKNLQVSYNEIVSARRPWKYYRTTERRQLTPPGR